jgi:hypothetical protein
VYMLPIFRIEMYHIHQSVYASHLQNRNVSHMTECTCFPSSASPRLIFASITHASHLQNRHVSQPPILHMLPIFKNAMSHVPHRCHVSQIL